jgi:ribonuclease P protein component
MRRFVSLRRKADFVALRRYGRRASSANFTLYRDSARAEDPTSLVGISVSRTVGKAVVRNRLRRRLSSIVHDALANGGRMRLLIVPTKAAADVAFAALRTDLCSALNR